MGQREEWGSRIGFVLAAIGSAVGLGNIWRFSYVAADNGGGIFFICYLFALLTAGIPLMVLEFGIGHKFRGSAPLTFARMNRKWEWLGWWQVLVCFFIAIYYAVIIAWAISFVGFSFSQSWGNTPKDFFFGSFLNLTKSPLDLGSLRVNLLIPLLIAWGVSFVATYTGVKAGIERINKVLIPALFIMMVIIAIRGVTLSGASSGLNFLFSPDFSRIFDYKVWAAAYGQIFFDLSVAFAIMITYSSYLPRKSDIVNNAYTTCLTNCSFSLLSGIAVFSILGHLSYQQNVPIDQMAGSGGIGLAFITFPSAISSLGPIAPFMGILFFLSLTFAGITSLISINEAAISAFMDKFNIERKKAVVIYTAVAASCSLVFATGGGLYVLDIVDHFVNNFGVVFSGLLEAIFVGWIFKLNSIQEHVNPISDRQVGSVWKFSIMFITPAVAGYMGIMNLIGDLKTPYGGYPTSSLFIMGWMVLTVIILGGVLFSALKWKDESILVKEVK